MKLKKVIAVVSAVIMLGSLTAAMPMSVSALTETKDFTHAHVYAPNVTIKTTTNVDKSFYEIGTVTAKDILDVSVAIKASANDKAAIGVYLYTPSESSPATYDNILENGTAIAAMGHLKSGGTTNTYTSSKYFNAIVSKEMTTTTASDLTATDGGNLYFLLQVGDGNREVYINSITVTKAYEGGELRNQAADTTDDAVFTLYNDITVNNGSNNLNRVTFGKSVTLKSADANNKNTISGKGNDIGWLILENGSNKTLTLENVIVENTNTNTTNQYAVVSENSALVINNSIINGQIFRNKGDKPVTLSNTQVNVTAKEDSDFTTKGLETNTDTKVYTATVNGYGNTFSGYKWNITAENEDTLTTDAVPTTITTTGEIEFGAVLYNLGDTNVTGASVTVE